jgi:hypothetical protein
MTDQECLVLSAASVGKNKYIWIACTLTTWCDGKDPEHYGYTDSLNQALGEIERAKDLLDPSRQMLSVPGTLRGDITRVNVGYARSWHQRLSRRQRPKKLSNSTESARQEFVYTTFHYYDEQTPTSIPHVVIKKTPKKIIIHAEAYRPGHVWSRIRTYHLDRKKLEETGRVFHRHCEFTLVPEASRYIYRRGDVLNNQAGMLGLTWPYTRREVIRAFRLKVKEAHPDKGGSSEEFIALRKVYDRLLSVAQ